MNTVLHLRIAGALLLALAAFNAVLPRYFGWRAELQKVSLLTRQIFFVHAFFIALVLVFFGTLSILGAEELARPSFLSRAVLAGFAIFWGLRLVVQLFVYDSSLWRGDRFRTAMHGLFTCLWAYLAAVYGGAWLLHA